MAWQLQKEWTRDQAIRQPSGFKKNLFAGSSLLKQSFPSTLVVSPDEPEKNFTDPEI
jgi:hypothetical protein